MAKIPTLHLFVDLSSSFILYRLRWILLSIDLRRHTSDIVSNMAATTRQLRRSMPSLLTSAQPSRQAAATAPLCLGRYNCLRRNNGTVALASSTAAVSSRRLFSASTARRSAELSSESKAPAPTRGGSKLFKDADAAVADVKSGSTILSSGFGLCGVAETLITALHRRGKDNLHSLTAVSNNAGVEGKGGLSVLTKEGQVNRLVLSYLGSNKVLEKKYLTGDIAIELCPQGTLAERIRSAGAGIPAFFTATGARKYIHLRAYSSPSCALGISQKLTRFTSQTPSSRTARSPCGSPHQARY